MFSAVGDIMMHVGDIMMHVGDIMSTVGGVQYRGRMPSFEIRVPWGISCSFWGIS